MNISQTRYKEWTQNKVTQFNSCALLQYAFLKCEMYPKLLDTSDTCIYECFGELIQRVFEDVV